MTKTEQKFDAIVVGSGVSGGWAAKELSERGLKTLMVERGPHVEHRKDYVGEGVAPWEMPFRGAVEFERVQNEQAIQQQCYAYNDATKQFFGNDRDLPYSIPEDKPFSWIRGNQLGGKSLTWHRQSYRLSDLEFTANSRDDYGIDWPVRYADLEDWYAYVERFAGISGNRDKIDILPDSVSQPPYAMNAVEQALKQRLESRYQDRKMIIGRCAHLTEPTDEQKALGRFRCMARNECQKGCSFGAYFSTQSATLPAALATGNLSVATDSVVHSVIYDEKTGRATGIRVIDANSLAQREYHADVVFLCASTIGTTQIMLNSTSKTFPNGIANSSGVLGHYLMDHLYGAGAHGRVPGFEDDYYHGRRPTGIYIPRFRNLYRQDEGVNFLRGYAFAGSAQRDEWGNFAHRDGFGKDFKQAIRQAGGWSFGLWGQGEMLPRYENQITLHPTKKDKWGMPQVHIDCSYSDNDNKMREDMAESAAEILEAMGCVDIHKSIDWDRPPGLSIHEMGTARMGRDPETSVLNGYNQAHDVPNLFVTDGACMTSNAWQNPSLTYMALTARACAFAAEQLKRGNL
ncbi:GMC oxidoreductase [Marinimicrobium alkaliphilum]|uniref:GMC oxidoreductase n=1 Tax=Marinimicrobium alkaliphilum TaxID=2202654 RepID=UPI000DBA40A7|nr:GMC family oxidoreductase [Marinimicrobium alkaliphilum]